MLVTLSASALKSRLRGHAPGGTLTLTDLPRVARDELGLSGMVLSTDLLVGADRQSLTKILEAADKAGCPCLVLIESTPQPLASDDELVLTAATDRLLRVAQAAAWLGCAAFALKVNAPNSDDALADTAASLKPVSRRSEKLELNLCIAPSKGLTETPERVTELLKKIGGFRVGTLPDFDTALASPDPHAYIRRLGPYASAILVPAGGGGEGADKPAKKKAAPKPKPAAKSKKKKGDTAAAADADDGEVELSVEPSAPASQTTLVEVLLAVGFDGPLALDFRGTGDPIPALLSTRDTIFRAIGRPEAGGMLGATAADLEGLGGEDDEPPPADE